jgi:Sigma-70, region 4
MPPHADAEQSAHLHSRFPADMPNNVWNKQLQAMCSPCSANERRSQVQQSRMDREEFRKRRQFQDELLKTWGYKSWKRIDRRNRPLRTKRAWVSFRARCREQEIVRLRCAQGLTFREIAKMLGISHVSAWRRFEWAMENFRLEDEYRTACLREIELKLAEIDRLEPELEKLTVEERENRLQVLGLIPKHN